MSTTIRNILQLPCMREATVVTGKDLLERTISSITVMEYTRTGPLQSSFQLHEGSRFNELAITGMFDICDDPNAQCELIRSLMNSGTVVMVLFYLGVVVKELNPKVLHVADEMGFIIITMPSGRMDLRYSDAIMEMSALINEGRLRNTYFIPELLDQFSLIPYDRRNTDILLRMISDRAQISLIITDVAWRVQHYATWPVGLSLDISSAIEQATAQKEYIDISGMPYFYQVIHLKSHTAQLRNMIVFSTDSSQLQSYAKQSGELVRLSSNIWNMQYDDVGAGADELIRALILGEPLRIRRLANLLNTDLQGLSTMWIIRPNDPEDAKVNVEIQKALTFVKKTADFFLAPPIIGQYEKSIVIVSRQPDLLEANNIEQQLLQSIHTANVAFHFFFCSRLNTPQMFHDTYFKVIDNDRAALRIFPFRTSMALQEIIFAEECQNILAQGEDAVRNYTAALDIISCPDSQLTEALRKTISTILIDAEGNIAKAAELLFVHKNTIKYRLRKINEITCANVLQMPQNYILTRAVALMRLIQKE